MPRAARALVLVLLALLVVPVPAAAQGPVVLPQQAQGAPNHGEPDAREARRRAKERNVKAPGFSNLLPAVEREPFCVADQNERQFQVLYAWSTQNNIVPFRGALLSLIRRANYKLYTSAVDGSGVTMGADLRMRCNDVGVFHAPNADFADIKARGQAAGFNRQNTKYIVFWDGNHPGFGGQGDISQDATPGATNLNNTRASMYSEIYRNSATGWGNWETNTLLHEIMHTMGAVQYPSAPHSTGSFHCTDGIDVMCYADTSDRGQNYQEPLTACGQGWSPLDCGEDDYFDLDPPAGSYLANNWNTGGPNNGFIRRFAYTTPAGWSGWVNRGGVLTSGPDASSWGTGRLDVFVRGTDMRLHQRTFSGGAWGPWSQRFGTQGNLASAPTAASWGTNRIDVFARSTHDSLLHAWFDGTWHGWEDLGGDFQGDPDVTSWAPGRLDVVVRGKTSNELWHKYFNGTSWSGWASQGGFITSSPTVASWGSGRLDVFARGADNALWHKWFANNGWSGWEKLGGHVSGDGPDASSRGLNRLDVFIRGGDDRLYQKWWDREGWSNWERLDDGMTAGPGTVSWGPGRVDVFSARGDNALWQKSFGS